MSGDGADDALTVLRGIWSVDGRSRAELDEQLGTGGKVCKNMARIGFGGMGPGGGGVEGTNTPVDADVRSAWRERLARDGKIAPGAVSIGETLRTDRAAGEPGR